MFKFFVDNKQTIDDCDVMLVFFAAIVRMTFEFHDSFDYISLWMIDDIEINRFVRICFGFRAKFSSPENCEKKKIQ